MICQLASYADTKNQELYECVISAPDYAKCSAFTDLNPCIMAAGFRWPVFQLSIYMPAAFLCIEMAFNRLILDRRHVVFPIMIALVYLIATAFSQYVSKKPIFPTVLDWTFADEART